MNWIKLALFIFNLLRELKKNQSVEEFSSSPAAVRSEARGDLLKWMWENKDQIIAFAVMLFEMFNKPTTTIPQAISTNNPEAAMFVAIDDVLS